MRRVRKPGLQVCRFAVGIWAGAILLCAGALALDQTQETPHLVPPGQSSSGLSASSAWRPGGVASSTSTAPNSQPSAESPSAGVEPSGKGVGGPLLFAEPPPGIPWLRNPATSGWDTAWVDDSWYWRILPQGIIYRSYLAGVRESRFASAWSYERRQGWMWDIALGGRVGMLRYGNGDPLRPEGFQVDIEGGGFPRLDLERDLDLVASDFRFGIPLTYGRGRYETKLAYYHLSSHLGDEWMLRSADWTRINYTRNALVWGHSYYLTENLRLYAEAAWSFDTDGGAEPWEFQFGMDYSPAEPVGDLRGAPFVALNAHLREEVDFGGNFVVQTGWQWRGPTGGLFRMGMQYFAGKSEQFEFYRHYEDKVGLGLWYDF